MSSASRDPLGNAPQGSNVRYGSAVHVLPGHYQGRRRIYTGQKVGMATPSVNVSRTMNGINGSHEDSSRMMMMSSINNHHPVQSMNPNTLYRSMSIPNSMTTAYGIASVPGYTIAPLSSSSSSVRPPLPTPSTVPAHRFQQSLLLHQQQQRSTISSAPSSLPLPYTPSLLPSLPSSILSSSSILTAPTSSTVLTVPPPKMLNPQAQYAAYLRLQYSQNLQQQQQQQLQLTKRHKKPHRPIGLPPSSALVSAPNTMAPSPATFRSPPRRPLPRNAPPSAFTAAAIPSSSSNSTALTLHRSSTSASSPVPRCSFNINGQCRHAIATRQCTSCVPFDPLGTGYVCDRCWEQRHPWYRAPHEFVILPLREEAKKKLPPIENQVAYRVTKETLELLNRTRVSTESLGLPLKGSNTEKTIQSGTAKCDELIEKMAVMILQLRDDGWMARERAARTIQKLFRRRKGVRLARRLLRLLWGKVLDPATNQYYYISRVNANRVTWNPPTLFGIPVDVPDYPRVLASQLTDEQAARMVQSSWRRKKVKRNLEAIALSLYRRVMDKESGRVYYYNMLSRAAQWNKPKALGTDLEPPFYNVYEDHVAITRAAILVQRNARRTKAKKLFIAKVKENYEQVWDTASQRYFYYSRKTGESTWTKPFTKYIGDYDLPEAVDEEENGGSGGMGGEKKTVAGETSPRKRGRTQTTTVTRKVRDKPMTPLEATMHLAVLLNVWRARKAIAGELLRVWQRVFDPEYGAYYYYNTVSGESTWYKPAIVKRLNVELPIVDMDDDNDDEGETGTVVNATVTGSLDPGTDSNATIHKVPSGATLSSFTTTHPENADIFVTAQENTLGDTARTLTQGGIGKSKPLVPKDTQPNHSNLFTTTVLTEEDAVAAGIIHATDPHPRRSSTLTLDRTTKTNKSSSHATKTLTPADALRMHWNRLLAYLYHVQPRHHRHNEILSKEEAADKFYKYGTRIWIVLEKQYPNTTGPYSIGLPFISPPYLFPGKGVDVLAGNFGGKIEGKDEDELNVGDEENIDNEKYNNSNSSGSNGNNGRLPLDRMIDEHRTRTLTKHNDNGSEPNLEEPYVFALTARSNVSRTSWDEPEEKVIMTKDRMKMERQNSKGNGRNTSLVKENSTIDSVATKDGQSTDDRGNNSIIDNAQPDEKKGSKKWWQFGGGKK